jgi:iron(III) transport system ATP-binding protein
MVFQQLALFPHLDVAGNIAYGLRHLDRAARRRRVADLLDLVDLPGMAARFPNQLSGGEAQRVAVARALAPGPDVVLLDEPFSSLDVALRAGLRAEIRRILRAAGVTTLLVTHDQDEALSMGDRVAIMFDGRLAQVGSPEDVYRTPVTARTAAFLGDANAVRGDLAGGRVRTVLGEFAAAGEDGPVTVLVRPEDLDLVDDPDGRALVTEVDYFGHDQLIVLRLGDESVRARLHARRQLAPGTTVRIDARPHEPVVVFGTSDGLTG